MRSIKYLFISVICLFLFMISARAECTSEDLVKYKNEAKQIKTSYTVEYLPSEEFDEDSNNYVYRDYFIFTISNVSSNLYLKVTDDYDGSTRTVTNFNNGTATLKYMVQDDGKHNLHYEIFANNNTACPNDNLGDNYSILPQHNMYSQMDECVDNDIPECQEFITSDVSYDKFVQATTKENEKKIEEAEKKAKEKETKKKKIKTIYIVAGSAGIVIIGIISFVVIRRIHEKRVRGF